jgi:hypothetical protein
VCEYCISVHAKEGGFLCLSQQGSPPIFTVFSREQCNRAVCSNCQKAGAVLTALVSLGIGSIMQKVYYQQLFSKTILLWLG